MSRPTFVLAAILLGVLAWWLLSDLRRDTTTIDPSSRPSEETSEGSIPVADLSLSDGLPAESRSVITAGEEPEVAPRLDLPGGRPPAQRRSHLEPGTIYGVVLQGEERMTNALVKLSTTEMHAAGTWSATTAESGEFRFSGLKLYQTYLLHVTSPDGAHREASVGLGRTGVAQKIVFGSGCIAGRVLDEASRASVGIEVTISGLGSEGGNATLSRARTDARGWFELCGLPAAIYWVNVHYGPGQLRQWRLALGPGERPNVRLGMLAGDPRWIGRVVDGKGRATPWVHLLLEELETGLWWRVMPDQQGRFETALPPTRFRIGVVFPGSGLLERGVAAGELVLGRHDVSQDVVVPGARVDFRFILNGQPATSDVHEGLWLSARRPGTLTMRPIEERDGDRFVCLGLEPGRHTLKIHRPYQFAEGDELHHAFDVPEGARTLEFDVEIRRMQD